MINFIEGKIGLGKKHVSVFSNYEDLDALAKEGLIEKREEAGGIHYYAEAESDGMWFGGFISLRDKKIEWLLLRWLDSPMKGWADVSEKAMIDEYSMLSDFVKKKVGAPPNKTKTGTRTWRFNWGRLDVSYEVRSFDVAIFMTPR